MIEIDTKTLDIEFEVKGLDDAGKFTGHASVFGATDAMNDVVLPGAFKDTLAAHRKRGRMPAMLWQHDAREPIGVWDDMTEDGRGLFVRGQLFVDDIPRARQAHALLKGGGLSGLSIGFRTVSSEIDEPTGARQLTEIELFEVSLVTFPALDTARVNTVKTSVANGALPSEREFERFLMQDAGFSRSQARTVMGKGYRTLLARQDAGEDLTDLVVSRMRRCAELRAALR